MFSLSINGALPVAFDVLAVTEASLETTNQAHDVLNLILGSPDSIGLFVPFCKVQLYQDSTLRFTGWVDETPAALSGNHGSWKITINGPWRFLDMVAYSSRANIWVGSLAEVRTQIPVLGQGWNSENGIPIRLPISAVIADAVAQVLTRFPGVFTAATVPSGLDIEAPWSEKQNITCGSVLMDQLGWVPGFSLWWDYSQSTPVLNITDVPSVVHLQLNETTVDLTSVTLSPRFDLLVSEVNITYVVTNNELSSAAAFDSFGPAGDAQALGSPHVVQLSFAMGTNEIFPAPGLAEAYQKSMGKLAIDTSASFVDETLAWNMRPGQLWGFAGVASSWSAYTSICQKVRRNLFTFEITVTIGHPTQVGLQRLVDLNRRNTSQAPQKSNAGAPAAVTAQQPPKPYPGKKNLSSLTVTVAVDGSIEDLQEALASTNVQIIGPSGGFTGAASVNGARFDNLAQGTYSVSAILTPGWKLSSDSVDKKIYVQENSIGATATLILNRVQKIVLGDPNNHFNRIILDAASSDGSVVRVKGETGDESKLETTALTLTNSNGSSVKVDTDTASLLLEDEEGKQIYMDVPTDAQDTTHDAKWQTLFVVQDGTLKQMMMFGTDPFGLPSSGS